MALSMIATIPPRGHHSEARVVLDPDGTVTVVVGTAEFGNGTATVHAQLAAEALGVSPARVRLVPSDTGTSGYDSGAFGSTGSVVAGLADDVEALPLEHAHHPVAQQGVIVGDHHAQRSLRALRRDG